MVSDYQYRNLFAEHFAVDYVIVDSGATVTASTGQPPTISGETFSLTNEDIKAESIKLNESLCSDRNLVFGKIESAKLSFSFKNNEDLPTDLTTQEIDVYLYFNNDSDTLFQVGRYTVNSDRYSENNFVRSITAYDLLYYIKDIDITDWYYGYFADGLTHKIIDILTDEESNDGKMGLFEYLSDVEGMPFVLASGQTLVNGDFMLGQTIESDSVSFEFFMKRILEFNGAFGHINRAGEFEFVVMEWYDAAPVRTVVNDERIPPTEHDIVSTWGIGGIDVYDQNNIRLFKTRNTNKRKPSIYVIVDSFIFAGRQQGDSDVESALQELQRVINHYNYKSCNVKASGDLCVEVGDRINVSLLPDEGEERGWFRSYVLIRTFSGIQGMTDTYQANGDKKQPLYQIDNDRWHDGDSDGRATSGSSGVSQLNDEHDRRFIELMRNYGFPMLDEPEVSLVYNKTDGQVEIKWEDPANIATFSPAPVAWAGTLVVRKEGSPPLHRWGTEHQTYGGTVLVDSTTRDAYKVNAYVDSTIQLNKRYYYAIMPYFVALDDNDHPVKHYRWTKVFSVDTQVILTAPTISNLAVNGVDVTVTYEILALESGTYSVCKLVAKKNAIPTSKTDGDKIIDISASGTTTTVTGLDEESHYYFVIFTEDNQGNMASSEAVDITTGEQQFNWSIVASNGLNDVITGNAPTLARGTMPVYDSATDSIKSGSYEYEIVYPSSETGNKDNIAKITVSGIAKITSSSVGGSMDAGILVYSMFMAIFANGNDASANSNVVLLFNAGGVASNGTLENQSRQLYFDKKAPLDQLTKDVFYNIKFEFEYYHGFIIQFRCYVNGELYAEKTVKAMAGIDLYNAGAWHSYRLEGIEYTYFKTANAIIEYTDYVYPGYTSMNFEDTTERSDFLTHYANCTSNYADHDAFGASYNIPDPRNNDYSLLYGNSGRQPMSYSNGVYGIDTAGMNGNGFAIPLKAVCIKELEFDLQRDSTSTSGDQFFRILLYREGSSNPWIGYKGYCVVDSTYGKIIQEGNVLTVSSNDMSWGQGDRFWIKDGNWHHFKIGFYDYDDTFVVDFIAFYAWRRKWNIKNIKLLCKFKES